MPQRTDGACVQGDDASRHGRAPGLCCHPPRRARGGPGTRCVRPLPHPDLCLAALALPSMAVLARKCRPPARPVQPGGRLQGVGQPRPGRKPVYFSCASQTARCHGWNRLAAGGIRRPGAQHLSPQRGAAFPPFAPGGRTRGHPEPAPGAPLHDCAMPCHTCALST